LSEPTAMHETVTKADLVEEVIRATDLPRKESEAIVETIFDSIIQALQTGDKIEIRGFGSFRTRQRRWPGRPQSENRRQGGSSRPNEFRSSSPAKNSRSLSTANSRRQANLLNPKPLRTDSSPAWTIFGHLGGIAMSAPSRRMIAVSCATLPPPTMTPTHSSCCAQKHNYVILNRFPYTSGHVHGRAVRNTDRHSRPMTLRPCPR